MLIRLSPHYLFCTCLSPIPASFDISSSCGKAFKFINHVFQTNRNFLQKSNFTSVPSLCVFILDHRLGKCLNKKVSVSFEIVGCDTTYIFFWLRAISCLTFGHRHIFFMASLLFKQVLNFNRIAYKNFSIFGKILEKVWFLSPGTSRKIVAIFDRILLILLT